MFHCRINFVWNIIMAITLFLITLFFISLAILLPGIVYAPSDVGTLLKSNCNVNNITYIENKCYNDTLSAIYTLNYANAWQNCIIAEFNVTDTTHNLNCTYIWEDTFSDYMTANSTVGQTFQVEQNMNV